MADLFFIHEYGHPPGHPKHMILYQRTTATVCNACGAIEIFRLDHDCFDHDELWNHQEWYRLEGEDARAFREYVSACERPQDPSCGCEVHTSLREQCSALPHPSWNHIIEAPRHIHSVRFTDRKLSVRRPGDPPAKPPAATAK